MEMWCGHTATFDFSGTAVAIRKAMTLHQEDSRMSVRGTQSRDLTTERWNASYCRDTNWRCKNLTTVVFAVWVFLPSPLGSPLVVDHRSHLDCEK